MLKYALMAVAAAMAVAVVFVLLPVNSGPRPEPRILSSNDTQPSTSFTIHDAPPPPAPAASASSTAPNPATPPTAGDLDAVMQRLRNAGVNANPSAAPDATVTAQAPGFVPPAAAPAAAAAAAAVPPPATPDPAAAPPSPPPARFPTVTAQGTRWRMARSATGYTISIDLGGGQVADVHVLPAFANLDPASINVRVDYLRDTILQNFSNQSGTYSFARDGSVSIER